MRRSWGGEGIDDKRLWIFERVVVAEATFSVSTPDVELVRAGRSRIPLETITGEEHAGGRRLYRLGYPNREVRQSLNEHLLHHLVQDSTHRMKRSVRLYRLLEANDFAGLGELFHAFYAGIPFEWYTNNDIARYEGYYANVFYSYFAALGLDVRVEDSTSHGRLDMAVVFNENVYLFELKVVELAGEGAAMLQLRSRGYADKY